MSWKIGFAFICLMMIAMGIVMIILEIKYSSHVKDYSLKVKRKNEEDL